jgi:hypothetical protein
MLAHTFLRKLMLLGFPEHPISGSSDQVSDGRGRSSAIFGGSADEDAALAEIRHAVLPGKVPGGAALANLGPPAANSRLRTARR